jgi:glutaredoxin
MPSQAVLYRMVKPNHLCPFGLKAKDLLVRHGFEVEDQKLTTDEATAAFKSERQVSTTPQIFIDGVRIGGYDALREHLGLSAPATAANTNKTSYQPVIAVFATTLLMALASVAIARSR